MSIGLNNVGLIASLVLYWLSRVQFLKAWINSDTKFEPSGLDNIYPSVFVAFILLLQRGPQTAEILT